MTSYIGGADFIENASINILILVESYKNSVPSIIFPLFCFFIAFI
jgi:hypothetical protein